MSIRNRRRRGWSLLVAAGLVVTAAACGDDDSNDDVAAPTTALQDETSTVPAEPDTTEPVTTEPVTTEPVTTEPDATEPDATEPDADDCRTEVLDELVPAAQAEGRVTVYSSQGVDPLNDLAEAFEAEYPGIDVEIVRDVDSTALVRVETERQTGSFTADYVVTAAPAWVNEKAAEGWFLEPTGPQFVCDLGYDVGAYVNDEGNAFEVSSVIFTFVWNTDLYPEGLESYEDLLDPALADGRIGVVDPTIAPVLADFYLWLTDSFGESYLEELAAQQPRIYPGAQANQEAVISGEVLASAYVAPVPGVLTAIEDGAPIDFFVPDEVWGAKFYGTIVDGAPNPNAAQLFADFMVSPAGQVHIHSGGSVLPDTPGAMATNENVRDVDLEAQEPDRIAQYNEEWNALFR